jgi:hypothetical protein
MQSPNDSLPSDSPRLGYLDSVPIKIRPELLAGRRRYRPHGSLRPRTNVACGFPALRSTERLPAKAGPQTDDELQDDEIDLPQIALEQFEAAVRLSAWGTNWIVRSPLPTRRRVAIVKRTRGASTVQGSALACSPLRPHWKPL